MKKILLGLAVFIVVAGVGIYVFREPLMNQVAERVTADMFVPGDTDAYDPGVPVGESFPAILATRGGSEITSVAAFMGERGMIFIANRSVDW
jgi:hypothetical protein